MIDVLNRMRFRSSTKIIMGKLESAKFEAAIQTIFCVTSTLRYSLELHGYVCHTVANLTHISIELGEKLFEIEL